MVAGLLNYLLVYLQSSWAIQPENLIQLPNLLSAPENVMIFPDFSSLNNPLIYTGAITLAVVASLETLLNLEAADKLDLKNALHLLIVNYGLRVQVIWFLV